MQSGRHRVCVCVCVPGTDLPLSPDQEKLDEDNAWYCPKCKELRQGTKQMQFWCALVT
jgi:hypothetical protein